MRKEFRQFLVCSLYSVLDQMASSDDWFERSKLVTRANAIIYQLGTTTEAIFGMDIRYLVTDPDKRRLYRNKLNEVIDIDDVCERKEAMGKFYRWLHEIGLLNEDE